MQILMYSFEIRKNPLDAFNEITKKKHLRNAIAILGKVKMNKQEETEEVYRLGDNEKIEYSLLKDLVNGSSKMVVAEYIKPHKITELWMGGIFEYLRFQQDIEPTEYGSLISYTIEYEAKLPKIIKGKLERDKISPYLNRLMLARENEIRKSLPREDVGGGDYDGGEEVFE